LASRIVVVLAIPFLARIYTPAEFGLLALFTTIASLLSSVACGRYEMAIVLPDEDRDSLHLLIASMVIATMVSALTCLLFWITGDVVANALGSPELAIWLWLTPVMIFSISLFNALRSWASRTGEFGGISRAIVGNTMVTVATQSAAGYPQQWVSGGLIIGRVVGQVLQGLLLLKSCWAGLRETGGLGLSFSRARKLLYRYRSFPLFDAGANFLNASSRELPVLMLGLFFSPVIVGFYSVGRRMLGIPVQLISNATAQVFFPKAAEELGKGNLDRLALDVFKRLAVAGVTPMLLSIVIMPEIIAVFLGEKWIGATVYVQWLTISVLAIFITAPFAQLFSVLEKQRERLVYVTIMIAVQVAVMSACGSLNESVLAVAGFSIVSSVGMLSSYLWLLTKAGVKLADMVRALAREMLYALPFIGGAWLVTRIFENDFLVLAASIAVLAIFGALRAKDVLGRAAVTA
jgi:O-antigen/teichoic acid export membrane protein